MICKRMYGTMMSFRGVLTMRYWGLSLLIVQTLFALSLGVTLRPRIDPNQIDNMSDEEIRQAIERDQPEFERLRMEYNKARDQLESYKIPTAVKDLAMFDPNEGKRLGNEYEEKRRAIMPIQNEMDLLQRELERRSSIPEDVKEYELLMEYLEQQYNKGVGTREEMVARYNVFVSRYPQSPLAIRAKYDAAMLYTVGCIRENGIESIRPEEARKLHEQIVMGHPDLLDAFVIWSRHELASLYPTADERFQGRLEFYKWLKEIRPEQYDATSEWMRRDYRFRNATESEIRSRIDGLVRGTIEAVKENIVYDAKASTNPIENTKLLEQVFGDSEKSMIELPKDKRKDINATADRTMRKETNNRKQGGILLLSWPAITLCIGFGILLIGTMIVFRRKRTAMSGQEQIKR